MNGYREATLRVLAQEHLEESLSKNAAGPNFGDVHSYAYTKPRVFAKVVCSEGADRHRFVRIARKRLELE